MKPKSTRTVLAIAGSALAALTLIPVAAQAQSYGTAYDQRGYAYDPCSRDQTARTAVGAVLGGLAGLALGNNVTDDRFVDRYGRVHDNDTGATVGAVVGALAGGGVGRNSAACVAEARPRQQQRYSNYSYAPDVYSRSPTYNDDYYYDRYQTVPSYGGQTYGNQPYGNRAYGGQVYGGQTYGVQSYGYDSYEDNAYGQRSCRMVESRVRMPDGGTQTRMVQACPDSQGRYQLVN